MSFTKGFLLAGLVVYGCVWSWDRGITQDGIVRYIEKKPTTWKGDRVIYSIAGLHEIFNRNEEALEQYRRVRRVYPHSFLAGDALFGEASALERMNRWTEAKYAYELYIEEYPDGKYARSVRKNVEFLRSR